MFYSDAFLTEHFCKTLKILSGQALLTLAKSVIIMIIIITMKKKFLILFTSI